MGHHVCVCVSIRVPQASVVLVERRWIPPVLFPFLCVISLPGAFCPSKGNWHAWMKCFALVFLFQGDLGLQGDKGDKVCMFYLWQRRAGQRKMKMRYLGTAEAASGDLICWESRVHAGRVDGHTRCYCVVRHLVTEVKIRDFTCREWYLDVLALGWDQMFTAVLSLTGGNYAGGRTRWWTGNQRRAGQWHLNLSNCSHRDLFTSN